MAKKRIIESMERPELWERLPNETQQQYDKFCAYRDMKYIPDANGIPQVNISIRRSIRKLCEKSGFKRQNIERYSRKFNWQERCEAYDKHIEELVREQNEHNIKKMQDNHARIAAQMLKKATARLLTIKDEDISASDIARLVDIGVKIERLSRGESTENQKVRGEVTHSGTVNIDTPQAIDLSGLSDEELDQLEQLLTKLYN